MSEKALGQNSEDIQIIEINESNVANKSNEAIQTKAANKSKEAIQSNTAYETDAEASQNSKFEEPEVSEGEDYTPLSTSQDDAEKERDYKEYKRLVKEIKFQNDTIQSIKDEIHDIQCKPSITKCEQTYLKELFDCLEKEVFKVRGLVEKAMKLQNYGSRRNYKEIPLAVTAFDEENMMPQEMTIDSWRASGGDTNETEGNDGICICVPDNIAREVTAKPSDQKLIKNLLQSFHSCSSISKSKKPNIQKNESKCNHHKGNTMGDLKEKVKCMEQSMNKLKTQLCQQASSAKVSEHSHHNVCSPVPPCVCPKCTSVRPVSKDPCAAQKPSKSEQYQNLKDNYLYLLTEFGKKDEELKKLTKRLTNSCGNERGDQPRTKNNTNDSELTLLRNRVNEMNEEQLEFKCLMREQSSQLDDYRKKYLTAQQKVEEQYALLEKLNMNNKRIEKQINMEVKEIRSKFQEKLNELLRYPKLLENEQLKLAKICKEKEDIESKLIVVCKELKLLKSKADKTGSCDDCRPQLQRCQHELSQTKKELEEIIRQRDLLCQQLTSTQEDLECLRSESAKIIARTKERCEISKCKQQKIVDRLEKELAQCRATACLSVNDRETVIHEMQGQLNTLSYSFDSAQKQIKTLRNHISYMSNENCYPAKI